MSPLLVVTAFGAEYQAVWQLLTGHRILKTRDVDGFAVTSGEIQGLPVELLITGAGEKSLRENLTSYLSEGKHSELKTQHALALGFCGGLSQGADVGALCLPDRCVLPSGESFSPEAELRGLVSRRFHGDGLEFLVGDMITVDRMVASEDERRALHARTGAAVVDMEAAHFAAVCRDQGLSWFVAKTVMDDLSTRGHTREDLKPGLETAKTRLVEILPALLQELKFHWNL
jgi:nucleoside phosphorylase